MRMYQLYLITNNINNKRYVGQVIQSKGYLKRFNEHINAANNGSDYVLHAAIRKYGKENFSIKLLLHDIPENKINFYETLWIDKFQTYFRLDKGYNMTLGGQGVHGCQKSIEGRASSSIKMKEYWINLKQDKDKYNEIITKRKIALKGRKFSYLHRQHISEKAKNRIGEKNSFYNKQHTEQTKKLISESNSKKVGMFDINTLELIKEFDSIYIASQYLLEHNLTKNINCSSRISKICRGIDKSAYGYLWKFI